MFTNHSRFPLSNRGPPNYIDIYDVRIMCLPNSKLPECQLLTAPDLTIYLQRSDVRAAIGVPANVPQWVPCNGAVFNDVYNQYNNEFNIRADVPKLLESGVKFLMYHGQFDARCGFRGGQAFLDNMQWSGAQKFIDAERVNWMVDGALHGYHRSAGGLTHLLVALSGHMVP
jgi:carboxypeptidase C (cathepsin A)